MENWNSAVIRNSRKNSVFKYSVKLQIFKLHYAGKET